MLSFPSPHFTEEQTGPERLTQILGLELASGGARLKSCPTPESTCSTPPKITFLANTVPPVACQGLFRAQSVLGAWPSATRWVCAYHFFFFSPSRKAVFSNENRQEYPIIECISKQSHLHATTPGARVPPCSLSTDSVGPSPPLLKRQFCHCQPCFPRPRGSNASTPGA